MGEFDLVVGQTETDWLMPMLSCSKLCSQQFFFRAWRAVVGGERHH